MWKPSKYSFWCNLMPSLYSFAVSFWRQATLTSVNIMCSRLSKVCLIRCATLQCHLCFAVPLVSLNQAFENRYVSSHLYHHSLHALLPSIYPSTIAFAFNAFVLDIMDIFQFSGSCVFRDFFLQFQFHELHSTVYVSPF